MPQTQHVKEDVQPVPLPTPEPVVGTASPHPSSRVDPSLGAVLLRLQHLSNSSGSLENATATHVQTLRLLSPRVPAPKPPSAAAWHAAVAP